MITIAIAVLILRDILQSYREYLSLSFFILFVLCLFDKVTDTFLHHSDEFVAFHLVCMSVIPITNVH